MSDTKLTVLDLGEGTQWHHVPIWQKYGSRTYSSGKDYTVRAKTPAAARAAAVSHANKKFGGEHEVGGEDEIALPQSKPHILEYPTTRLVHEETEMADTKLSALTEAAKALAAMPQAKSAEVLAAQAEGDKKPAAVDVSEDLAAMFKGSEISEAAQGQIRLVFEAAVGRRAAELIEGLSAEMLAAKDADVAALREELVEQTDGYLQTVVDRWTDQNRPAIESSLKVEIAESFMAGLRRLLAEHHVEVPEGKDDLVEELAAKVERLQGELDDMADDLSEARRGIVAKGREAALDEACEGLTAAQAAKLRELAEGVDGDGYSDKLRALREAYFDGGDDGKGLEPKKAPKVALAEQVAGALDNDPIVEAEAGEEEGGEPKAQVTPQMQRYVASIKAHIGA